MFLFLHSHDSPTLNNRQHFLTSLVFALKTDTRNATHTLLLHLLSPERQCSGRTKYSIFLRQQTTSVKNQCPVNLKHARRQHLHNFSMHKLSLVAGLAQFLLVLVHYFQPCFPVHAFFCFLSRCRISPTLVTTVLRNRTNARG